MPKMDHLKTVMVNPNELISGNRGADRKYISWGVFLDTWRVVDGGEYKIRDLPLYGQLHGIYLKMDEGRRIADAKTLNVKSTEPSTLAEGWLKREIGFFKDIRDNGFDISKRVNPITGGISGDGRIHVIDGNHGVSILIYLKHDSRIPINILNRDDEWVRFKSGLHEIYGKKLLYQPLEHPDFQDWKVEHPCIDRWDTIKDHIVGERVLDIGCLTGWFSRRIAESGRSVVGVDSDSRVLGAAKIISAYKGFSSDNPSFLNMGFEKLLGDGAKFDTILCLNVLHHYIRNSQKKMLDAVKLMSEHSEHLILELETKNIPIKWDPELILKETSYSKYEVLKRENRPIYVYTK